MATTTDQAGSAIQTVPTTESPTAPESGDDASLARDLARQGVAAFAAVIERLGEVRALHVDIGRTLEDFAALLEGTRAEEDGDGPAGGVGLARLAEAMRDMQGALAAFETSRAGAAARGDIAMVESYVVDIARGGRALSAVATLTRTTAAASGIRSLEGYLSDLSATATEISNAADAVLDALRMLADRQVRTVAGCRSGAAILSDLLPRFEDGRARLADLDAAEAEISGVIAGRARALARDGSARLKAMVTAMQFSDRLAQRLDHIATIFEARDPFADRLGAAQARATAAAIEEVAAEVRAMLDALGRTARDGAGLFADAEVTAAARRSLSERARVTDLALHDMARVEEAVRTAEDGARLVQETGDAARESFRRLERCSKTIATASVNATLVASRSGDVRGPLGALSTEVRVVATRCLASVGGSEARLNGVVAETGHGLAALAETGASLRSAVAMVRTLAADGTDRLARLDALSAEAGAKAETMLAVLDRGRNGLTGLDALRAELESLGRAPDIEPIGTPDPALLAQIWDSYTMDEERRVHAEVFAGRPDARPGDAGTAVRDAAGDDIEDLLF